MRKSLSFHVKLWLQELNFLVYKYKGGIHTKHRPQVILVREVNPVKLEVK